MKILIRLPIDTWVNCHPVSVGGGGGKDCLVILIRLPIDTWVNCHPVSVGEGGGGGWEGLFGFINNCTDKGLTLKISALESLYGS